MDSKAKISAAKVISEGYQYFAVLYDYALQVECDEKELVDTVRAALDKFLDAMEERHGE